MLMIFAIRTPLLTCWTGGGLDGVGSGVGCTTATGPVDSPVHVAQLSLSVVEPGGFTFRVVILTGPSTGGALDAITPTSRGITLKSSIGGTRSVRSGILI